MLLAIVGPAPPVPAGRVDVDIALPFCSGKGRAAQIEYSSDRNQFGVVSHTITTVWCTELGTTLPYGSANTTVNPAYFPRLNFFRCPTHRLLAKFLSTWSRTQAPGFYVTLPDKAD